MAENQTVETLFDISAPLIAASTRLIEGFVAYLPQLIGAMILLVFGWFVAKILKAAAMRLMHGVEKFSKWFQLGKSAEANRIKDSTIHFLSSVLFWITILFFVTAAASLLGLSMFTVWLDRLIAHLPNILSGGLIVVAGIICGNLAYEAVTTAAAALPSRQRTLLGRAAQIFTLVTLTMVGVEQIGIDVTVFATIGTVVIGALFAGLAFAFSFGARSFVANLLGARYLSSEYRIGERIRIGEIEGTILEVSTTTVVLETSEGRVTVPAKLFGEEMSTLLERPRADG